MGRTPSYTLVSMTNKDVYKISRYNGDKLVSQMLDEQPPTFFETTDIGTNNTIIIVVPHISSIVVLDGSDGDA